jgi:hypothetical protein
MPTHERLGSDDCENLQDWWKPAIQLDKEPAIIVCEPDAATHPAPQDHQLMSKHRVLSLKPQLRLERQGQDGQSETEQPDHSASLGDSITSSTRIRFSVHTGAYRYRASFRCRLDGRYERKKPNPESWLREARWGYSEGASRDLCFGEGLSRRSLDKRREPHHFYRMVFGNYEIKADFGGQRITNRNSATAFMLTLTAIYRKSRTGSWLTKAALEAEGWLENWPHASSLFFLPGELMRKN